MGLFDKLFPKKAQQSAQSVTQNWQLMTGYAPAFYTWSGNLYESELCRSAMDAKARHISKLKVEFVGSAQKKLKTTFKNAPNAFQTWGQFLYRASTILDAQGTCCIVPILDKYDDIIGVYSVLPSACEIVEVKGQREPFVRYSFANGKKAAIELSKCGILTRFQYENDIFGTNNAALKNTLALIDLNNQGMQQGIKNAATFRFMATVNNFTKQEQLTETQREFNEANFKGENGGLLLFPNYYHDIKQIDSKPFTVDDKQLNIIRTNVFEYFGVNEDVLQNKAYGDAFSAFYEGVIEVFAIQLSDVITKMVFSNQEQNTGNKIFFSSNRLQYMSNADKLSVSAQMADRGLMNRNEIREIWNLPPIEGGDDFTIRGEYYMLNEAADSGEGEEVNDG